MVNEQPLETCPDCPLNGYPLEHIHVAKPLSYGGRIFGQFSVTLPRELFSPDELSVLGEISEDLSFAIHHLLLGREKEEYHLTIVKRKVFLERFTHTQDPTFVVTQEQSGEGATLLRIAGTSATFLHATGFDEAINGMPVSVLAGNVRDGEELVRAVEEVVRSKIPRSVSIRSDLTGIEYVGFIFAPDTGYAGVTLIPTVKTESSLGIGRKPETVQH